MQKITVQDLEDLGNSLESAVNCLEAIHDAMTAGNATADQYTDGLFFCMIAIKGYSEELTEAVRTAYKQAREKLESEVKL